MTGKCPSSTFSCFSSFHSFPEPCSVEIVSVASDFNCNSLNYFFILHSCFAGSLTQLMLNIRFTVIKKGSEKSQEMESTIDPSPIKSVLYRSRKIFHICSIKSLFRKESLIRTKFNPYPKKFQLVIKFSRIIRKLCRMMMSYCEARFMLTIIIKHFEIRHSFYKFSFRLLLRLGMTRLTN